MLTYGNAPYSESGKYNRGRSSVAVLGFPSDLGASTRAGQAAAPVQLRLSAEEQPFRIVDSGNIVPATRNNMEYLEDIAWHVHSIAKNTDTVLALGGDDSITYGIANGLIDTHGELAIAHYDAHPDMYGRDDDIDHANWIEYATDLGVPIRQYGCRARSVTEPLNDNLLDYPLLLAIDMDVIDPAYAPGVSVPEPFGITPRELLADITHVIEQRTVVGICITEINPALDHNNITARTATELVAKICTLIGVS